MDYAEARRQLEKRHEESYSRRQDSGMFHDIFIQDLPEGLVKWKCKEGEHLIDIIPFVVGTKHPFLKEGTISYLLDVYVHTNIGPRKQEFICLTKTEGLGHPCPICEYQDKLRFQDVDDKVIKRFNSVRRSVYNIICYDSPQEEAKGFQIWYIAHFFMEQKLLGISKRPKGGGKIYYTDLEHGKQVAFERQGTGRDNTSYLSHQFIDRDGPLPIEFLQQTYTLDELIHWPKYDEIKEALFATAEVSMEDGDKAEAEAGAPELTEPEPPAVEQPQVEKEVKPELPPPVQETPVDEKVCPHGYRYGKDNEEYDECNGCPKWEPCADEAVVLAQKKVAKHEAGQQPATTPDKPELALRRRGS